MRQSGDVLAWLNEFAGIVLLAAGVISFVLFALAQALAQPLCTGKTQCPLIA
jgi:hypothetical protein